MADPREIWILRHAEASPTGEEGDASRLLTPKGERRAVEVGRALAARGLRPARILASPLARARATADLVAEAAEAAAPEVDRRLAPGEDAEARAREVLAEGPHPALLVGHNPDLEGVVLALTGTPVALRKGMLVRIAHDGRRGTILEVL
jgi:phosphohistidine phosphatase